MEERWVDNIHYFDYTPDSMTGWLSMEDSFVVARAYIYQKDQSHSLGIVVLVSGPELRGSVVTPEHAIHHGARLRDTLVDQYGDQALTLQEDEIRLYSWNGQKIG